SACKMQSQLRKLAQPQRTAMAARHMREMRGETGHRSFQKMPRPQYLPPIRILKKRLDEILFVETPLMIANPCLRIVEGKKNIVHMNQNAGRKPGQNIEEQAHHVVSGADLMAGVDEKYVPRREFIELGHGHILHGAFQNPVRKRAYRPSRVGIDRYELG